MWLSTGFKGGVAGALDACWCASCSSEPVSDAGGNSMCAVMGSQLPGHHTHTHKKNSENETEGEKKAICVKGEGGLR